MKTIEELARSAIGCGLAIHRELGPGLLETAYEALLARSLEQLGLQVERQKSISLLHNGVALADVFRADLHIEQQLLIELKSVERLAPVHPKQVLTYLRHLNLPLGLLMNFGAATFKEGVQRILNARADTSMIDILHDKDSAQP